MKNIKPELYIIPGWGEKITQPNYQSLIKAVGKVYEVVLVKLPLFDKRFVLGRGGSLSKLIKQAKTQIKKPAKNDLILGFSIGALIVYKLATKIKFKQAIICSISPILEKDLSLYPPKEVAKMFTLNQTKALNKTVYGKLATPTHLIYGSLENKECIGRSHELYKINKNRSVLMPIVGAKHKLNDNYLKSVKDLLLKK